jgi:hypothetical protein
MIADHDSFQFLLFQCLQGKKISFNQILSKFANVSNQFNYHVPKKIM